ncbi:phage tail domain-containing protein [Nesterenkonia sp.]|uniref:phage tail domain-containing protein n=1 Tax=Nesterenkonia sp. TaxID=704201 RepID=UPI002636F0B3|nr:phage tail domain-containing protein [Nesterenkonia sp.]
MSFTLGGISTANLDGVTAVLEQWPSLGGHTVQNSEVTGKDGRFYHDSNRTASRFVYDVIIEGNTPEQAAQRRDAFVRFLDPAKGPRSLVLDADAGWVYLEVLVADEITWDRMTWEPGLGFRLRGEVTLETQGDAEARELDPTVLTTAGELTYTHELGTTSAYPTISITTASSHSSYEIQIGSHTVTVDRFSNWTENHRLVLNYEDMAFYLERTSSGERLASAVRHMSTYQRPALHQGQTYTVQVSPQRPLRFYPNARRA